MPEPIVEEKSSDYDDGEVTFKVPKQKSTSSSCEDVSKIDFRHKTIVTTCLIDASKNTFFVKSVKITHKSNETTKSETSVAEAKFG